MYEVWNSQTSLCTRIVVELYFACALAVEIELPINTSHFSKSKRESITQEAIFIVLAGHSAVFAATTRVTHSFSLPFGPAQITVGCLCGESMWLRLYSCWSVLAIDVVHWCDCVSLCVEAECIDVSVARLWYGDHCWNHIPRLLLVPQLA